jgi:hypothetical protein
MHYRPRTKIMKIITTTTPTAVAQARRRLHIHGGERRYGPFLTPRGQMQRRPSTITPPPRTMATSDSRQLPLPLNPRLSRPFICPPTDRIFHHQILLTCRLRHSSPLKPSNVQGQIRRPLPDVRLITPRGHMEHLLKHWKLMTPRKQRRRNQNSRNLKNGGL